MSTPDPNANDQKLQVDVNRAAIKWSFQNKCGRVLWALVWPLFVLVPRPFWAWRRFLLRLFGAKIGRDVHIYPTVRITMPWHLDIRAEAAVGDRAILYALGTIQIGARTTISQGAHLCAGSHDIQSRDRTLLTPPITIAEDAWVAADAFVGPGVTIGRGAIIGARSVVVKDIPPYVLAAGNPALIKKPLSSVNE